jgi:hypothetical protein
VQGFLLFSSNPKIIIHSSGLPGLTGGSAPLKKKLSLPFWFPSTFGQDK